jgi:hypothetical protein
MIFGQMSVASDLLHPIIPFAWEFNPDNCMHVEQYPFSRRQKDRVGQLTILGNT